MDKSQLSISTIARPMICLAFIFKKEQEHTLFALFSVFGEKQALRRGAER